MTTIAVLGTGIMGFPIARNLAAAGFDVRAWNRTRERAEPLAEHGVTVADNPRAAVQGADVVITMLIDADAVETTMDGLDGALTGDSGGLLWLQMSTVGVDAAERFATLADKAGMAYVDAPVLGTKQPAEQGALTVLASGPDELQERCRPVFDAIGKNVVWVGPTGRGSRLKLAVNSWVLAMTTATAEALGLARGLGLDPQLFLDTIAGGPLDTAYAQTKGGSMLRQEFPPAFPLAGAVKDAGLILDAARDAGVRLRVTEAVHAQMTDAADAGRGDEDMAAVWYAVTGESA
jgi:3-hydroxyisobutyrate dehydrogenase